MEVEYKGKIIEGDQEREFEDLIDEIEDFIKYNINSVDNIFNIKDKISGLKDCGRNLCSANNKLREELFKIIYENEMLKEFIMDCENDDFIEGDIEGDIEE